MNKQAILILGGAVVGLMAVYYIDKLLQSRTAEGIQPYNAAQPTNALTAVTAPAYSGVKMQMQLYPGAPSSQEIEILQRYINIYNGANVLTPTGVYDTATEKYIKDITGKSVTTLHEFRYMYMATKGLNAEADKVIKGL